MSTEHANKAAPSAGQGGRRVTLALGAFAAVGVLCLAWGLLADPLRAIQGFHVSFLYWTGLAFVGATISAIFQLTSSGWGQNVRRLAECSVALLPLVLVAYVGVCLGHHTLAPAAHHPEHLAHAKQVWLEPLFLLTRDGLGLLFLSALSLVFVYYSLRPELGAQGTKDVRGIVGWIVRGYRGHKEESERAEKIKNTLAPILCIAYALVLSLIAFDQIMALDPTWISTLFGGYYFITTLFLGWCGIAVFAVIVSNRKSDDALAAYGRRITVKDRHDLGKLMFAFCMLSGDFFWSQFVVIWYGNIPEETPFILRRVVQEPWRTMAITVAVCCFAAPFLLLLSKRIKRTKSTLLGIGILVMAMAWLERFVLVAPSTWHPEQTGARIAEAPLGLPEVGVALGFFGAAGLCYRWALRTFIVAPVEDQSPQEHPADIDLSEEEETVKGESRSEPSEDKEQSEDASSDNEEAAT